MTPTGSLLLRARIPAEEGALVVAALEAGREAVCERADVPAGTPRADGHALEDVPAETPSGGELLADSLLLMADTMLAHGPASRPAATAIRWWCTSMRTPSRGSPDAAGRCELADGEPLAAETARRLACDAGIVPLLHRDGRALDVGRKTRSIPPALRRALSARDRGCRFPGCDRARVDAHHIEHWARGGATSLENPLVHLCRHHHGLVHEGGFAVERTSGGELVFRRPDGRTIARCPAQPRGRVAAMRRRGVAADACVPLSGERMDLDLAVDAMVRIAPPRGLELVGAGAGGA